MPHHQDKQSTVNEMLTSAPKASAPNLDSVSFSDAGGFLNSTFSQSSTGDAVHFVLVEDDGRTGLGHARHNLVVLLRLPHNPPAQRESSLQIGTAARRRQAGWKTDCLSNVLSQ